MPHQSLTHAINTRQVVGTIFAGGEIATQAEIIRVVQEGYPVILIVDPAYFYGGDLSNLERRSDRSRSHSAAPERWYPPDTWWVL